MRLVGKTKHLGWYLNHPRYYRTFIRRIIRNMRPESRLESTRGEAVQWARECAVDTLTGIAQITGRREIIPLREKYAEVFAEADRTVRMCPVKMGGAGDLELLYYACDYLEARTVVETGVAYGWSSLAILLSLKNRENARLFSTDMPYPIRDAEKYVGCVVVSALQPHWNLLRGDDRDMLPEALAHAGEIDLCHYDSDKSYEGRMWAYPLLWNALRPGGIFISDDIGDNVAFHDFCQKVGVPPIVIKSPSHTDDATEKFIGLCRKPG